jgi:hypothetical protein
VRDVITTYLGKEVNDKELAALFKKWADESFPADAFRAWFRIARSENRRDAEDARWTLFALSDYSLQIVDAEKEAA